MPCDLRLAIGPALALGLLAGTAHSDPVEAVIAQTGLKHLQLSTEVAALDAPKSLMARLDEQPQPIDVFSQEADLSVTDLRIVLVQLARVMGGNDQLSVLLAQPQGRMDALSIDAGGMDLETLLTRADALGHLGPNGLTIPVVISGDAQLRIEGQVLPLDRANGAFLANFGRLDLRGGGIEGQGDVNPTVGEFRPFIVTAGTGSMGLHGGTLRHLGYGRTSAFSGVAGIEGGLYRPTRHSVVNGMLLQDVQGVSFVRARTPVVRNSIFADVTGHALELRGTTAAVVADTRFINIAEDAIRIDKGAVATRITEVEIFDVGGNGIRLLAASDATHVEDALIWDAAKSAYSADRSDCLLLRDVQAVQSGEKGVSIRRSRNSRIERSAFLASGSSGLFIADQPTGSVTRLFDNRFAGNKVGLTTASPAELRLEGNNFSDQFPRFLKGDLQADTQRLIADLTGAEPLVMLAGGVEDTFLPELSCTTQTGG